MPRYNLMEARVLADLTQEELADAIGAERRAVIAWERGDATPQPGHRRAVRRELNNEDPHLFVNYPAEEAACQADAAYDEVDASESPPEEPASSSPCHLDVPHDRMDSSDSFHSAIPEPDKELSPMDKLRRAINNAIGTTLVGVNLQVITAPLIETEGNRGPTVPSEEYIPQCSVAIDDCREWLSQGKYSRVERALQVHIPTLRRLATTMSPHQETAASLAVEAYILLIRLATVNLQFADRKIYCVNAVQFGALSGDRNLHAIALEWHGNTYTLCYHQPQRAIAIFNEMLPGCNSDMSQLTKSAIYSNLSIAHAQNGNEHQARDYMEMAHTAMPSHPELDFSYRYIQFNASSLDHYEGIVYLHLTEHFPNGNYAQQAYYALEKSISKHPLNQSTLGRALIKRADAARALGDMGEFVKYLTQGFSIGVEIDSIRCLSEAGGVMGEIPPEWKREDAVQDLQKEITHAIVVARR